MDWVNDLRNDHLDAPVKHHLKPGIAGIVDSLRLKGFTKANCPSFPKGNARNYSREVGVQDTDAKYLRILKKDRMPQSRDSRKGTTPSFRKEASILRTETSGSHFSKARAHDTSHENRLDRPMKLIHSSPKGASQVPVEAVAETFFQLAGKDLTRR